jgi:hypothetical protein
VALVAEEALAVLLRPSRFAVVLLAALGVAPILRNVAVLVAAMLLATLSLDRHRNDGETAMICRWRAPKPSAGEVVAETVEQPLD